MGESYDHAYLSVRGGTADVEACASFLKDALLIQGLTADPALGVSVHADIADVGLFLSRETPANTDPDEVPCAMWGFVSEHEYPRLRTWVEQQRRFPLEFVLFRKVKCSVTSMCRWSLDVFRPGYHHAESIDEWWGAGAEWEQYLEKQKSAR